MWALIKILHLHRGFAMRVQLLKVVGGGFLSIYLVLGTLMGINSDKVESEYQKQLAHEYAELHVAIARQDLRMDEIERRQREIDAMQIEHRLTMTEATGNSNHVLLTGIALSMGLLALEAMIRGFAGIRKLAKGEAVE